MGFFFFSLWNFTVFKPVALKLQMILYAFHLEQLTGVPLFCYASLLHIL